MALSLCLLFAGNAGAANQKTPPSLLEGRASWYGELFQGRPTASGEPFDMNALTAAHMTLPLGSIVRVVNLENGKTVIVRINDRGPFKKQFVIDLSHRAARDLGMLEAGTALVRIEPMDKSVIAGKEPEAVVPAVIKKAHENRTAGLVASVAKPPLTTDKAEEEKNAGSEAPATTNATTGETADAAKKTAKVVAVTDVTANSPAQNAPVADSRPTASAQKPVAEREHKSIQVEPAADNVSAKKAKLAGQPAVKPVAQNQNPPTKVDADPVKAMLDNGYYIQVGAFSKRNNAKNYTLTLREKGFEKSRWYRKAPEADLWIVIIGPFEAKQDANNRLAALKNAGHNGFVKVISK
ncbi:septal ring lytic transglycosylase RlpA family protein [Oleidesulfovibrio sp.]|uniref:septal ring lytic transglycosylase RlpA family protein n=1 Tax=Oleidesulfovibrio sp. TaxID=2909707 RepID=UPI003A837AFB